MMDKFRELLNDLPDNLGGHTLLSAAALGIGLIVSIPMGIAASRRPKLAEVLLGVAGILQTIPTLALLVIMVPLLGGAIGFTPAFIALTLYSILPILANTITGIRGIDPVLTEAARGLGMNDWQILRRVQLPLAAPVIISGVRTATVLVVGTATLATPVGGKSLGNYIFAGLESNNMASTIFGCVFTALLAIILDQLVHLLELAVQRRSKPMAWWAAAGLAVIVAGGLYGPVARLFAAPPVVVASGPFTEQIILSEALNERLKAAGLRVDQRQGMGETIQFLALPHEKIDCCINYTGNIWATLMKEKATADRETIYPEIRAFLRAKYDVECLGKLGFENAYCLAMRQKDADRLGIATIADLAKRPDQFTIAGDLQFFGRDEWNQLRAAQGYGLRFKNINEMDPGLMYQAIESGTVDVICAYSSDGRIAAQGLKVLDDPRQILPPYDAILLLSRKGARNARLREALLPLVDAVDNDRMRQANRRVDVDQQTPRQAARGLLMGLNIR